MICLWQGQNSWIIRFLHWQSEMGNCVFLSTKHILYEAAGRDACVSYFATTKSAYGQCLTKEINLPAFYTKLLSAYKMTESPICCTMLKFAPIMRIAPMRLQCVKKIPTQNLQFALLKFAPIIRRNCLASALNFTNNVMLLKGDSRYLRLSEHLHHIRSQNSNSTFSQCWGPKKPTGMSRNRM